MRHSANWSTDWLEINEREIGDEMVITNGSEDYVLRVRDNGADGSGEGAQREVDLSGFTCATLSLECRQFQLDDASDYVTIDASDNGGSSWTEIGRLQGPTNDGSYQTSSSYDISAYIASNTRIRFKTSSSMGARTQSTSTMW